MKHLLADLNDAQRNAVTHDKGPLLVLAGAGAGKTRVITYRIAYLMSELNVSPYNIMAVTFTNKAAQEMRERLHKLEGNLSSKVSLGTFHSISLLILRREWENTELGSTFSIIDQDDRLSTVREVLKELNIDYKKFPPKPYLTAISEYKNKIEHVERVLPSDFLHRFQEVFVAYESKLRQQNLIDFDDMLSRTLRLFLENPEVLKKYREQYKYILVDEYQDTNEIQFRFLKALAGQDGNICVVGDDDQSIYGWRGAEIENILNFESHFDGVKEIKLIENYRSTADILKLANQVICNNTARRGKNLVAAVSREGKISRFRFNNEQHEADFIAKMAEDFINQGIPKSEIAVLYRTNAQSRNFEVAFNKLGIPYKVVGGTSFYQRREIKDVLSYLRFFDNPYDENSFKRASKNPPKGLGDSILDKVSTYASSNNLDLRTALNNVLPLATGRQRSGLMMLQTLMMLLDGCKKIADMVNCVVSETNYKEELMKSEDPQEAKARIENIYELFNSAAAYDEMFPDGGNLGDFLATTTLASSTDEDGGESIKLMTIHAAKGLEFETVFLTGLEEGLFPLSSDGDGDIEEERRLCYVGITRARINLIFTHTESRLVYGQRQNSRPSRFLKEIELKKDANEDKTSLPPRSGADIGPFRPGQRVTHETFGEGIVLKIDGKDDSARVDVIFSQGGVKKLVARFLNPL